MGAIASLGVEPALSPPPLVPAGLGHPWAIYAHKGLVMFAYRGRRTGDVLVTETRPDLSAADWRKELTAVPALNGHLDVTGTVAAIHIGVNARALQTVSPCVSGSATDRHRGDSGLEVVMDGDTLSAGAGARAARLTKRAVTPA